MRTPAPGSPGGWRASAIRGTIAGTVLVASAVVAACGGESHSPGPQRTDSAGVEIVYSAVPQWPEGDEWRVGEILLAVGSEEDPLFQVAGVAQRPGGGVMVALGGAGEVRWYDGDGALAAALGRPGEGPGEFGILQSAGLLVGDTVWAFDFALRRFTLLHPGEGVLGTLPLEPAPARALVAGVLPGGGWILREGWGDAPGALGEGLRRDPVRVYRAAADGRVGSPLASLPGREVLITSEGGRAVMGTAPFARDATVAVVGEWTVLGDQAGYELRLLDPSGATRHILRWEGPSLEITEARAAAWVEARLAEVDPRGREQARAYLEGAPRPDRSPAYGAVLAGGDGEIWVADYALPGGAPAAWTVLAPGGGWLGSVAMPAGFTPVQVLDDRILGVERDDLGVERVVVRALVR